MIVATLTYAGNISLTREADNLEFTIYLMDLWNKMVQSVGNWSDYEVSRAKSDEEAERVQANYREFAQLAERLHLRIKNIAYQGSAIHDDRLSESGKEDFDLHTLPEPDRTEDAFRARAGSRAGLLAGALFLISAAEVWYAGLAALPAFVPGTKSFGKFSSHCHNSLLLAPRLVPYPFIKLLQYRITAYTCPCILNKP